MASWNGGERPFETFRQKMVARRWQTPCRISTTYDDEHQREMGDEICGFKHFLFHWKGRKGCEVTLISDSIGKWIRNKAHLEVQAIPGLSLHKALVKMCLGELNARGFLGLILHVGCNDFSEGVAPEIVVDRTLAIVEYIQQYHRSTRMAVGIILPRPQDEKDDDKGVAKEQRRAETNKQLKVMCRQKGVLFANFKDAAINSTNVSRSWYARDDLHLNKAGIEVLGEYYEGIACSLMERI